MEGEEALPWVAVAAKKDLESKQIIGVEVSGKRILLANLGGTFYAIGDKCTHAGCMLSDGSLKGENVRCGCHGSTFSLRTGNVVQGPAKKPEPTYQVKAEGEQILVNV
jgi:nitrite reductase/ring-hydroxylating ferredoxin subunit